MFSKIIVLTQVLLVAQTITVPPIWPKQNADFLHTSNIPSPTHYPNIQPKNIPVENHYIQPSTHLNPFPSSQTNYQSQLSALPSVQFQSGTPKLQYRAPISQEVHIYHPRPSLDTSNNAHRPSSYQIVNFPNQPLNILNNSKGKLHDQNVRLVNKQEREIDNVDEATGNDDKAGFSEHEFPREVPTKPIYPGEGQWAKHQLRHKPYVDNRQQDHSHSQEERENIPEGYDTFEQGQEQFQQAKNRFSHDIGTFTQRHNLNSSQNDDADSESEPLYEKPEIGFIPQKLYAQVRRTEIEKHLPRSAIDPEEEENASRLREIVKDSKIHTVYTEEGYEDSAYDHAGHEKHAENSEGHSQLAEDQTNSSNKHRGNRRDKYSGSGRNGRRQNVERRKLRDEEESKDDQYDESVKYKKFRKEEADNDNASSNINSKRIPSAMMDKLPTKNIMKVKLRTGNKEDIDMEIHTEVKYVPGSQKKKHKFVKIIPSYQKQIDIGKENKTKSDAEKPVIRVKRYDKNDLSKRYVRKRPNYYWKKAKTSTTERPLLNMRRKFEAAFKNHSRSFKPTSTDIPMNVNEQIDTLTPTTTIITSATTTTISATTTTDTAIRTSTTPRPPPTPPIEDHQEIQKEISAKNSKTAKPNSLKIKIRKYIVKRQKRFTIDHPTIDIDLKEFVDVKKLPNPTTKPDLTFVKYPYYKLPITDNINEYSPLRYAEDMENIPKKTEDLSFYESRSHIECPEIESNVDPIPEKISEQEEDKSTEKTTKEPDLPRLRGLGDKIDCLKIKYFGENPLDSPFFQEEIIHVPVPLLEMKSVDNENNVKVISDKNSAKNIYHEPRKYNNNAEINENINGSSKNNTDNVKLSPEKQQSNENNLKAKTLTFDQAQNETIRAKKREVKIKILEPIVVVDEDIFQKPTMNPIHQKSDAVLKPPFTLLQMMDMNLKKMKLKPKSIYDQITILEEENAEKPLMSDKVLPLNEKFIVIYENEDININKISTEYPLENKIKMIQPAVNGYKSPKVSDIISDLTMYSQGIEQPGIILSGTFMKNIATDSSKISHKTEEHSLPKEKENTPPKRRKISIRKSVKKPTRISNRKTQKTSTLEPEIFTSRSSPYRTTTSLPISEIPNSEMPQPQKFIQDTVTELTTKSPIDSYLQINRRYSLPYLFDISKYLPKLPNHKIITSEVHYKEEIKPSDQMRMYSDVLKTINKDKEMSSVQSAASNPLIVKTVEQETAGTNTHEGLEIQKKQQGLKKIQFSSTKSIIHDEPIAEASNTVIGLVPPSKESYYKTLFQNQMDYKQNRQPSLEIQNAQGTQNYYYIFGLKPPLQKKEQFKIYHQISKRDIKNVNPKSKSEIDNLLNDENFISFINKHNIRSKRDVAEKEYELEDLVAEESRSYEVTPSRKPKVYTEIVRAKPAKIESEEESEELNPRKRVYELKPINSATTENTVNIEQIFEDEIPEQTEPPTTPIPIIYPVEANPDNSSIAQYVFLIDRLHDKWEKENPTTETVTETVPETTSQNSSTKPTEAMQTVAESINVPTGEPAFLQIINQLHVERKEEEKKNPTTTTTEDSVVIEDTSSSDHVKNSNPYILESIIPESFMSELNSMQAKLDPEKFNDNSNKDGSSRMRNFSAKLKTSIDTSKYKTIERSPVNFRHNLSSRYNADDQELPLTRVQTTQQPTIITMKSQENVSRDSFADVKSGPGKEEITTKAEPEVVLTTTVKPRQQLRPRSRSTTITTTEKPRIIPINPINRRRRPTRIPTTEATVPATKSQVPHTRRRSRVRPESQTRSATKETVSKGAYTSTMEIPTTETTIETTTDTPEDNKKQRRMQTIHERRVVSEVTLTRFYEPNSDESGVSSSNENVEETRKHQYQIIGPLSQAPEELYSDPHLAKNVNQLKGDQQSTVDNKETVDKFETLSNNNNTANLYPNMARMINRLAETQSDTKIAVNHDISGEDDIENESSTEEKPVFIRDPSKRMYYYVKL